MNLLRLRRLWLYCLVLVSISGIALAHNNTASPEKKSQAISWIGVITQDLNDRVVKKEKLKDDEGAYVSEVVDYSPADSAGIQQCDVIVEFNGKKIEDAAALSKAVRKAKPGETVQCVLLRAGKQQSVSVVVGKKKNARHNAFRMMIPQYSLRTFAKQPMLGLRVIEMSEQLAKYFSAPDNEGVLVEEVTNNSPAANAGFQAGDVILRAGKRTVDNVEDIRHELRKHDEGDKLEFEVLRKGMKKILDVEIEETEADHFSYHAQPQINMLQSEPTDSDDGEWESMFDEIKPNLDELRLNLERMKQEMRHSELGTEIEKQIIRYAPDASESVIL
jgi:C-terminal processing protease CtpA/Prc